MLYCVRYFLCSVCLLPLLAHAADIFLAGASRVMATTGMSCHPADRGSFCSPFLEKILYEHIAENRFISTLSL
ncbi:MAG: hypothetical protein GW875_15605 [Deltaproteobacteria bacterium]|nr:hypothetical protein [Deltaproteobacteria bacterium]